MIPRFCLFFTILCWLDRGSCRDEDKIMKACFWSNEVYEPCFGGCAEITCDNPRNHLRPCYPYCEPGCICEEPYIRDDRTHQCVLPQDCSPTQMGIPVTTRRADSAKQPTSNGNPKYVGRSQRNQRRHQEDVPSEFLDGPDAASLSAAPPTSKSDDYKKTSELSRMGNYFNIVIAPPPIKALHPRKMHDVFNPAKRF